jgi:hypothetical protein
MLLVGEAEADAAMRRLKMGKTELKRVLQHKRLLAQLPDPKVPGPPPPFTCFTGTKVRK